MGNVVMEIDKEKERKRNVRFARQIIKEISKMEPFWDSRSGCSRRCRDISETKMEVK